MTNDDSYDLLLELAPDAFLHGDTTGNLIGVNQKACELFGYTKEELLTMNIRELFPQEELEQKPLRYDVLNSGKILKTERKIRKKNGDRVDREMHSRRMPDGTYQSFIRDISYRKQIENKLLQQLDEKEMLLREVHHRIKNNMASVASLLSLQASSTTNPEAQELLLEAMHRVLSIESLYEKLLYENEYKEVHIKSYLEDLISLVMEIYNNNKNIVVNTKVDDFSIDAKRAVSVGIIISELLTNICKYAFKDRDSGVVDIVVLKKGSFVNIEIKDNGVGYKQDQNSKESSHFGLYLVKTLLEQLKGTFLSTSNNGVTTNIEFPL